MNRGNHDRDGLNMRQHHTETPANFCRRNNIKVGDRLVGEATDREGPIGPLVVTAIGREIVAGCVHGRLHEQTFTFALRDWFRAEDLGDGC